MEEEEEEEEKEKEEEEEEEERAEAAHLSSPDCALEVATARSHGGEGECKQHHLEEGERGEGGG